jgi:hypothetical protein
MSMSDNQDSASSHDSVEEPVAQLAKIFKTTVKRVPINHGGGYKYTNIMPWDGKEPGPDDILFIYAVLSDRNLRQMSLESCFGDNTKRNIVEENESRAKGRARQPDLPNVTPLKRFIPDATVLHLPSDMSNLLVGSSSHFLPRCFIPDSGLTIAFLPYLMHIGEIYGHLPPGTHKFTTSKHSTLVDTPVTYFYKLENDDEGVISTDPKSYDRIRPLREGEEGRYTLLTEYVPGNPTTYLLKRESYTRKKSDCPLRTNYRVHPYESRIIVTNNTKPSNTGGGKTRRKLKIIKRRNRRNKTKRRNTIKRRSR